MDRGPVSKPVVESMLSSAASRGGAVPGDPPLPQIPGYRLERILGRGGMGVVYLAREITLDRLVALKVLSPRFAASPAARRRFSREARALARVEHPHVVPIHGFSSSGALPFIAMAYIPGDSLRIVLGSAQGEGHSAFALFFRRAGANSHLVDLAAGVVAYTLADALVALHQGGIVHRDVKPANIVLDSKGRPVLVDFGVACDPGSELLACDVDVTGTLRFMPPEALSGGEKIEPRSDIYSLGVTLFEMLTLRPAFDQVDRDLLMEAVVDGAAPAPMEVEPAVPETLDLVVRTAMAPDPNDRYPDARGFREALRSALVELTGCGLPGSRLDRELRRTARPASLLARLFHGVCGCFRAART